MQLKFDLTVNSPVLEKSIAKLVEPKVSVETEKPVPPKSPSKIEPTIHAVLCLGCLLLIVAPPISNPIKTFIHGSSKPAESAGKNDSGNTNGFAIPIKLLPVDPVSSEFGWRVHPIFNTRRHHDGIDFASDSGNPVRPTASGKVVHAGSKGGYGLTVIIEHGQGIETLYAHLSEIKVKAGDSVDQKTVIGLVGSTGNSTGPHLHLEFRENGNLVNPRKFLKDIP